MVTSPGGTSSMLGVIANSVRFTSTAVVVTAAVTEPFEPESPEREIAKPAKASETTPSPNPPTASTDLSSLFMAVIVIGPRATS
ncbi:unannotated protein [freshwater metagenome]|uniref:Unannotated protein n=1 Tax=freshwater metagenome TaxID=449393 RepID=A0A6J6PR89_9ZZZZ